MTDVSSAEAERINLALNYITDVLLALSLFGCAGTIVTFLLFNDLRTYPIKLIVYLCLSIFFAQLFFWLSFELFENIMCIACAMILHYFFLASFFWTFCVAFNFYQMIVRRNRDAESLEKIYHIVCWTVPLVVVIMVVSFQKYANVGGYCYIYGEIPIFLSFFLPGLIIVSSNGVIFFFIAREIHDTLKSAPKADKKEKSKEYRVYFSIFVSLGLSWILGFLLPFLSGVSKAIFLVLYSLLTPPQGFLIFISYCINAKVGSKWAGLIDLIYVQNEIHVKLKICEEKQLVILAIPFGGTVTFSVIKVYFAYKNLGYVIPWFNRYQNMNSSGSTSTTSATSGTSSNRASHATTSRDSTRNSSNSSPSSINTSSHESSSGY